jgi:ethanolamine utilization protein EutQ (cupin superfamily)
MSSEEREVYIMEDTDEEWVRPTPAGVAIRKAVARETGLDDSDLGDLTEYVEFEEVRAVLEGDGDELTITIEGHTVTVLPSGDIEVDG